MKNKIVSQVTAAALLLVPALGQDAVLYGLNGVGYQNADSTGLNKLSMGGGAPITISGQYMNESPSANSVMVEPLWIENFELFAPALSPSDEFNSNGMAGKIGFTTPTPMELLNAPLSAFNGESLPQGGGSDTIQFKLKVHNDGDSFYTECSTYNNCMFTYNRDYTALLLDVTPSNVYKDQLIQFHMNGKSVSGATPSDEWPMREIRLGSTLVDWEDLILEDQRLSSWSHDTFEAYVGDQVPNSSDEPKVLMYNGYAINAPTSSHCNFAGDDCWSVRTHPKIEGVSASSGFTSGGQDFIISGHGLNGTDVVVYIDDVECEVTEAVSGMITCVTGEKDDTSLFGYQPGQAGLTREKTDEDDATISIVDLVTSMEIFEISGDVYKDQISGWFTAPTTGSYRFLVSCSTSCNLYLDSDNPYDGIPLDTKPTPSLIAYRSWSIGWRTYFYNKDEGQKSEWIDLEEDEQYYIMAESNGYNNIEHMTVSLEIKSTDGSDNTAHPKTSRTIQQLSLNQVNTFEEWSFTIGTPDDGTYQINFSNPTTIPASLWQSEELAASASAATVRNFIVGYYWNYFGSNIEVTLVMYDAAGVVTLDALLATTYTHTVKMLKVIEGFSTNAISVKKVSTESTFAIIAPKTGGIQSSAPINGTYAITCSDSLGVSHTSSDINYNTGVTWIQKIIDQSIPFLAGKVTAVYDYEYSYWENGVSFILHFVGLDYDQPACTIHAGVGEYPLSGNNPVQTVTVVQNFGDSVVFEPVHIEFLSSDAQAPQIFVMVDGIIALCPDLMCDYEYLDTVSEVTDQSLSGTTLTISGIDLPTTDDVVITFGTVTCIASSLTTTQIVCDLETDAITGDWVVIVKSADGTIPDTISGEISIGADVTSVSPNTDINSLGGGVLTIVGNNFGYCTAVITVEFQDGTTCTVISADMTEIQCEVEKLTDSSLTSQTLTVSINGIEDTTLTVAIVDAAESALSLSPSSVSPVLKTEITITLDSNYGETLVKEDFTVVVTSETDAEYERSLYVMSVDDSTKSIVVKFPGAPSGDYIMQISATQSGRINSDTLDLSVHSTVTSISPLTGSTYGGALVTITGENFSDEPLDNPVKIGDHYCYVITTSTTEITCRTDYLLDQVAGDALVIVFLKTSEEAQSDSDFIFTFTAPVAEVSDITAAFDESTETHQVTVDGSSLDDTTTLYIDGYAQELVSWADTQVIFKVINMDFTSSSSVQVYTSEGYPGGSDIIHYLDLTPSILAITPSAGSSAGSLITVEGTGFGMLTEGLNLQADGTDLCSEIEIISYGVFTCLTNAAVIASGAGLDISIDSAGQGSFVASGATFTQQELLTVSSATLAGNTITFTGTGFMTDGSFTAGATFAGVTASSATINSATEVVATWATTGIAPGAEAPVLYFEQTTDLYQLFASVASSIELEKELDVTSSSSGLECSFAGGCTYSIESSGLYAMLLNEENSVQICGAECILREDLSDGDFAVCELPLLVTNYSVDQYTVTESGVLDGEVFPEDSVLVDGEVTIDYVDSKSSGCNFGMTFKEGYVAILDEAKVYINFITSTDPYVDQLSLQGSNDEWSTSDTLFTYGADVHEGWNYVNYREDGADKPAYNSYRFYGDASGSCRVTEFRLTGVEAIDDDNSSYDCDANIMIGEEATSLNSVTYSSDNTPLLSSIVPRFGSVLGGESITLTGTNFGTSGGSVFFDNRECTIDSHTDTEIVCTTSDKPYVADTPCVMITIDGYGSVATQGLVFMYISRWSDTETWGGDIPPIEGESISIPAGQHLLVDVDSTPQLVAIIVEGSLIFAPDADPTHVRTFDAGYIMVSGGYMEVGTEDFPYTSKIVITMYGDRWSPYLPIYGNKVIGIRFGILDMHGVERDVVWTRLADTAEAGDTSITLIESVDWVVGEEIVIAGTGWHNNDAETRIITAVSGETFSFDEPLVYMHLSVAPTYDGVEMPMRAEVGLLTRNVVFRGDPVVSPKDKYGAHIMIHSPGDESSIGRISYIELKDVGQAFKLGRYPIHFHMIGTVHKSYVEGNSVHQTYNRAVTTHGVHYFRVINNVAFDTMGHTYFIEDAAETKNIYDHNLAIQVKKSMSLLNTDQSPGGFWITHPDNVVINNAIAGTDAYGYWYDMQTHAVGPSADNNICPEFAKLGEFRDNSAHSTHKYGLRIFHALVPRTYPCKSSPYDADYLENGETDPYWQNPKVQAVFENMVAWKCGRNGAISERTGAVTFLNFKIADSKIAGIEYSMIEDVVDGYAKVVGGMVIGNSGYNDEDGVISGSTCWGLIGPRTEYFTVEDVSFYNLDYQESAALGSCSHCFHPASTDSGGRTFTVSGLVFDDATVPRRIKWQFPYREIIHDLDGSLTELGADTWATYYYIHNDHAECTHEPDVYDGLICDSSVQVRRIAFSAAAPGSFNMQKVKVAKWDQEDQDAILADETTFETFRQDLDLEYWSWLEMREKKNPSNSWPIPVVTGHKYRIHWGENADFTAMRMEMSPRWTEDDLNVHVVMNFTDVRASINITDTKGVLIANESYIDRDEHALVNGDCVVYNQTEVREFHYVINGKDMEDRSVLYLTGHRCIIDCDQPEIEEMEISDEVIYWSNPGAWPSGAIPVEGEEVEIIPGANMILDIETPLLTSLTVNGRLTFLQVDDEPQDLTIHTMILYIRQGELLIGSEDAPYIGTAQIILYGEPEDETLAYSYMVEGGNKVLAVLGTAKFYGQPRDRVSRIKSTISRGDTSAMVSSGLDWKAGDMLAFLPTATQYKHTDYMEVESYDEATGELTFTKETLYYHWGQATSTGDKYNGVDMRGEVVLLSRNVRVIGHDTDSWGGQIVVSDNIEESGVLRTGQLVLDHVEVYNCSQRNTFKSAIRFESVNTDLQSITNVAVWGSTAWAISAQYSSNILIEDSVFIGSRAVGLNIISSQTVTMNNLIVGDVMLRPEMTATNVVDKTACIAICSYFGPDSSCQDVSITNSIAAGCHYVGFTSPGHNCEASDTQSNFRNNVAHSVEGSGAHIFPNPALSSHSTCYEGSHFAAYKNYENGLGNFFSTKEMIMTNMTLIDNVQGISLQTAGNSANSHTYLRDSHIYGETEAEDCPYGHECLCPSKIAFMVFGSHHAGKDVHITMPSALPPYKIKSYGAWSASATVYNVIFEGFNSTETACGASSFIFKLNDHASDYVPIHTFKYTTFINVHHDAIGYIMDPNPGWNNPTDCVGFPCTAPSNVVLNFKYTSYEGSPRPEFRDTSFQIVSDTPGASENLDLCEYQDNWNAWLCTSDYLGQLVFLATDGDQEDRSVAPIYVTNEESGFTNKLNSMMDHMWDGFYTGQKHKSQFSSLVQTDRNYTVEYTGTPFNNMRYVLRADKGQIKVTVPYWNAGSYTVWVDGEKMPYTEWDKEAGSQRELTGYRGCGENRYIGVKNFLEFILTPDCEVTIKPEDAILCNVRMQWTMDEFYAAGGVVSFADRVAAALGIHASQVKVVAVYTGSVVTSFFIVPDEDSTVNNAKQLRNIERGVNKLIRAASSAFGAPILSADTDGVTIIEDASYNPTVNPNQVTPTSQSATPINKPSTSSSTKSNGATVTEEVQYIDETAAATASLLVVFLVLVLACVFCFGMGAVFLCVVKSTPASLKEMPKAQQQKAGEAGLSLQSEVDMNPQFHPNQDFDIDIFSNKKRVIKQNEEYLAANDHENLALNHSEQKLQVSDRDLTGIELQVKE